MARFGGGQTEVVHIEKTAVVAPCRFEMPASRAGQLLKFMCRVFV
jgi:hypothetical protein